MLVTASGVFDATSSPPAQPLWAYSYTASDQYAMLLGTVTVPSATGTGTSTATFTYDDQSRLIARTDGNGNKVTYYYNDNNTETEIVVYDSMSVQVAAWTQTYDAFHRMTGVQNTGHDYSIGYTDPYNPNQPTIVTDTEGRHTLIEYDAHGNVTSTKNPKEIKTIYDWDYTASPFGRLMSVHQTTSDNIDRPSVSYTYYEPYGLAQTVTTPAATGGSDTLTATFNYDFTSHNGFISGARLSTALSSSTGWVNNAAQTITTTLDYGTTDPQAGHPLTATDNLGHSTHFTYDGRGNLASVTDALGNRSDFEYNIANQLRYSYFPATGQTGTSRGFTSNYYAYDGGPLTYTGLFDESGTRIRKVDYAYGQEGELLSVSGDTSEAFTNVYDALYRLKTLTDGFGRTTEYTYQNVDQLTQVKLPNNDRINYNYDSSGLLLSSVTNDNETDLYTRDFVGAVTKVDHFSSPVQYDSNNNPLTANLVATETFSYDSSGRMVGSTDSTGSKGYSYGDIDQLLSVTTTYTGLPAKAIAYTYFPDGSQASMTLPGASGPLTHSYTYDGLGRPASMVSPFGDTTNWTYYDNGWLASQSNPAINKKVEYGYTALGQVSAIGDWQIVGSEIDKMIDMLYDGAGNRTAVYTDIFGMPSANGLVTYAYNSKDQLTGETSTRLSGFADAFNYDAAGNPIVFRGSSRSYNDANQISASGYVYDDRGNSTTYGGSSVMFDLQDRATNFPGYLSAGYTGDGLRAWKQNSATATTTSARTYYLYDGMTPVAELDATGAVSAVNSFGANGLVSRYKTSTGGTGDSTFYTFDERGNTVERRHGANSLETIDLYTAYGSLQSRLGATTGFDDPFGFGGQWGYYTDNETNLILCGYRYYDPNTGRWLNRDPIGYDGGLNVYAYANGNPIMGIDPSGLSTDFLSVLHTAGDAVGGFASSLEQNTVGIFGPIVGGFLNFQSRDSLALMHLFQDTTHLGEGIGTHAGNPGCDPEGMGIANDASTLFQLAALILPGGVEAAEAGGVQNCFVAGTPVWMADGTTKSIEDIKEGDVVFSRNADGGADSVVVAEKVLHTFQHVANHTVVVTLNTGERIECTEGHPFFVAGLGWTPAGRLCIGNVLVPRAGPNGAEIAVARVEHKSVPTTVYNFEVDVEHSYFVGGTDGGIWVHNVSGLAEQIANGHAFDEHVLQWQEFNDMKIWKEEHRGAFAQHIDNVIKNATGGNVKKFDKVKTAYWDDITGTIVIHDPNHAHGGTAFRPFDGKAYFNDL